MLNKKIFAILMAAAIAGSAAGCSKTKKTDPSQDAPQFDPPFESSFETRAPIASNEQQVVGKVTSVDGKSITVELGELKQRTPSRDGNGSGDSNRKERSGNKKKRSGDGKDRSGDDKRERPSDFDGKDFPGGMFSYTFNATGGTATYDLSGLTEIKLENDSDDTPDTVEEIKTGDVVVIEVGKDGKPASLTVKTLSRRGGNRKPSNRSANNDNE